MKKRRVPVHVGIALVVGLATAVATFLVGGLRWSTGEHPEVTIINPDGIISDNASNAVKETRWSGRTRLVLVAGSGKSVTGGECAEINCLAPALPEFYPDGTAESIAPDAVVVWIDESRSIVTIDAAPRAPASITSPATNTMAELLGAHLAAGTLDDVLARGLQAVSDLETDDASVLTRIGVAFPLGAGTALLTLLLLQAWSQRPRSRHSRRELGSLLAVARENFTKASLSHDNVALIGAEFAQESDIGSRVARWQDNFAVLARALYEVESLPPSQWREYERDIEDVSRHASELVASAEALNHDRDLVKQAGEATKPPAYFQSAIDAVRGVNAASADDIAADLDRPRPASQALAAWDRIALKLADLGALSGVDEVAAGAPARIRSLAAAAAPARLQPEPVPDRPDQLTLPVSPVAVMVLGLLSLVVGGLWAWSPLWLATEASATTGTNVLWSWLISGTVTFVALLILFFVILRPLHCRIICRRLVRRAEDRLRSLSLISDALTLEVALVEDKCGYDVESRWRQWNERYDEALRMSTSHGACDMTFVHTVALLHLQAESLWRIRGILAGSGPWRDLLRDDVAPLARVGGEKTAKKLSTAVASSGQLPPRAVLDRIDEIARRSSRAALLRGLSPGPASDLAEILGDERGSLGAFDLTTPAFRYTGRLLLPVAEAFAGVVTLLLPYWKIIGIALVFAPIFIPILTPGRTWQYRPTEITVTSTKPASSVTIRDDEGILDARAREMVETTPVGGRGAMVVYTAQACGPADMDRYVNAHRGELAEVVADDGTHGVLHRGSMILCISPQSYNIDASRPFVVRLGETGLGPELAKEVEQRLADSPISSVYRTDEWAVEQLGAPAPASK